MPITAKMKMMMTSTTMRLPSALIDLIMILRVSLRDFQDLANLKTRRSRNDRSMERPSIPSARSSTSERTTMKKSKMFQPS